MGLIKFFNFRTVAFMMLALTLTLNTTVQAQVEDTSVAPTAPTDQQTPVDAVTSPDALDTAASPQTSTLIDTSVPESTTATSVSETDYAPLYKTAAYYILLFFLVCVFLAIIGKVLRLYELSNEMQGKPGQFNWNKIQGVLFAIALIAGLYGTYWTYVKWGNVASGNAATIHGERIDSMMTVTVIITTIVLILTHILLFGFSYKYSAKSTRRAYFYPHNNALERLWTIVPAIVLTVLVLLGFFTWRSITNVPENEQRNAIQLEVVAEQFKWNLRYAGADNQLGLRDYKLITPSNSIGINFKDEKSWDDKLTGEIYLPVNRPVRIHVNSKDVLHGFYVPEFRAQILANPGMPTYFQFTPTVTTVQMREKQNDPTFNYVLLCSQICGSGHYNMQVKITVVSEQEYQDWLSKQPLYFNDDVKKQLQMAEVKGASESNKIALN